MKYKKIFVMSKYLTMEDLLRAKIKYLEAECDNALARLHQCKRRSREDKVRLWNIIANRDETIDKLRYRIGILRRDVEGITGRR